MIKPGKTEQKAVRSARLSAALRENLKRRKAQARGRAAAASQTDGEPGPRTAATAQPAPDFGRNQGGE
jgi:hypothetical protein